MDLDPWKGWQQRQLPAYNIPAQFRSLDPNVQYQPTIELLDGDSRTILRLGPSVISYHRQAPYSGSDKFKTSELLSMTKALFDTNPAGILITRLGLRYMNALRPKLHDIDGISALDLKISVSEDAITKAVNLNFTTKVRDESTCAVRIELTEFLQGPFPPDTSVFVDVDVYTNDGFRTDSKRTVDEWVEFAHTQEKIEFFHLFKQATIEKLKEE